MNQFLKIGIWMNINNNNMFKSVSTHINRQAVNNWVYLNNTMNTLSPLTREYISCPVINTQLTYSKQKLFNEGKADYHSM